MYVPNQRPGLTEWDGLSFTHRDTHTHACMHIERERERGGRKRERDIQDADCDKGLVRQKNRILPGESSSHLWIFYSLSDSMAQQDFWEKKKSFKCNLQLVNEI